LQKILKSAGASTLVPEEDFLACDGNVEELVFERLSEVKLKEDGCYLVIPDTSRVSECNFLRTRYDIYGRVLLYTLECARLKLGLPNPQMQVEEFLGWREHLLRADEEAGAEAAVLWLRVRSFLVRKHDSIIVLKFV